MVNVKFGLRSNTSQEKDEREAFTMFSVQTCKAHAGAVGDYGAEI